MHVIIYDISEEQKPHHGINLLSPSPALLDLSCPPHNCFTTNLLAHNARNALARTLMSCRPCPLMRRLVRRLVSPPPPRPMFRGASPPTTTGFAAAPTITGVWCRSMSSRPFVRQGVSETTKKLTQRPPPLPHTRPVQAPNILGYASA